MKPIVFTVFLAVFFVAWSPLAAPKDDGRLSLFNYHENEYADILYRKGTRLDPEGLKEISHIMRSRGDGLEHAIDPRLVELLGEVQEHFGAETIEIVSGYRSPAYNRSLKQEGHSVAGESLHMLGQAADIHIDEVREEDIFDYVKGLGKGGVGFYPRFAFVHVDVGPPRAWQEKQSSARVLVGTENNPNPAWSAITDKNIYSRGDAIETRITNNDYKKQKLVANAWTERFRRGEWTDKSKVEETHKDASLQKGEDTLYSWDIPGDQPFGKYRLVIFTSKDFSIPPVFSNEFYVKK